MNLLNPNLKYQIDIDLWVWNKNYDLKISDIVPEMDGATGKLEIPSNNNYRGIFIKNLESLIEIYKKIYNDTDDFDEMEERAYNMGIRKTRIRKSIRKTMINAPIAPSHHTYQDEIWYLTIDLSDYVLEYHNSIEVDDFFHKITEKGQRTKILQNIRQ